MNRLRGLFTSDYNALPVLLIGCCIGVVVAVLFAVGAVVWWLW